MTSPLHSRQLDRARALYHDPAVGILSREQKQHIDRTIRRGVTTQFTVTNVSQLFLPADGLRKFLFIQNNAAIGSVTVSVGGAGAVLGVGFNLAPNGAGILLDINCPTDNIFVIGSVASNPSVVYVVS